MNVIVSTAPILLLLTVEFSRDLRRVEKLRNINELLRRSIGGWTDIGATDCSTTEFPQKSSASNTHG
ncbi:hypothetical protein ACE6H2_023453 [Prunus campanulata]